MKRQSWMILLAVILLFILPTSVIWASDNYQTVYSHHFNDVATLPDGISESVANTLSVDSTTFQEDAFHQKFLKLRGTDKGAGYPKVKVNFNEIKTQGVDQYAEISFDLYTHGVKKAQSAITLQITQDVGKFYMANGGGLYIGEDASGTKLADTAAFDDEEWKNYRLVFHLTDENGTAVNQLIGVYEDGVNVMGETYSFQGASLQGFSLQLSPKTVEHEYYLGFDNLSVSTYHSKDGNSQVPERAALMYLSKQVDAAIRAENNRYTEVELEMMKTHQQTALTLFYQDVVTVQQVETLVNELKFMLRKSAVAISGIRVKKTDGNSVSYITGGTLERLTLTKYDEISEPIVVTTAVYDKSGVLEACDITRVDTASAFQNGIETEISVSVPLSEDIRQKQVRFLLWDMDYRPCSSGFNLCETNGQEYKMVWNGVTTALDVGPTIGKDGHIYLPAKQMVNLLGMACDEKGGVYTAESDFGAKVSFGSDGGMYQGRQYPAIVQSGVIMIPAQLFEEAFGIQINADEFGGTVTVQAESAVKFYGASPEGLISYTASDNIAHYEVSAPETAKVEIWYKRGYSVSTMSRMWNRAQEPVYQNGKWVGGISGVGVDNYHFRTKITEGNTVNIYEDYNAAFCQGVDAPNLKEMVGTTNEELFLNPTYENIGYAIDKGSAETCIVTYREKGKNWAQAYSPAKDEFQFRGSIVGLKDGTEYEVKARLMDGEGKEISTKTAAVTTQSNNPVIAKTVKLSEIYRDGGLLISGYHGSKDGWIRIYNDGVVIDAGKTLFEAVLVEDCSYVILDGFVVKGGYRHGINVADNSSHIRIINCDISGWGRAGVLNETTGRHIYDGAEVNFDAGVALLQADHVTVERCYIHNSDAQTNSWKTAHWEEVHPQGSCGIYYAAKDSVVIRYNDIIGNYHHLFNDGIEGYQNGSRAGAASNNCDIYGNMIYQGEDDGMELDGAQLNARVYQNRIERFYCGVSLAPNLAGPSYLFKNLIVNLGTTYSDRSFTGLKIGGTVDGVFGMHYLFNNTIDSNASAVTNSQYGSTTEFHSISANNIFVTRRNWSNSYGFRNIYADERDRNDYDLVGGKFYIGQTVDGTPVDGGNVAKNSLQGYPLYVNANRGNYRLSVSSPGTGSGIYLDNFCEEANPNMGAYAKSDTISFMPYRPVDMRADFYSLTMTGNSTKTVKITFGEKIEGEIFTVCTDNQWLTVDCSGGKIVPGETVAIKIAADTSKAATSEEYGDEKYGMVLVRLDNGYSIPIAITLNQ